ncbi:hypothetical protein ACJJTC_010592 [Scirpophaga incertulas]
MVTASVCDWGEIVNGAVLFENGVQDKKLTNCQQFTILKKSAYLQKYSLGKSPKSTFQVFVKSWTTAVDFPERKPYCLDERAEVASRKLLRRELIIRSSILDNEGRIEIGR